MYIAPPFCVEVFPEIWLSAPSATIVKFPSLNIAPPTPAELSVIVEFFIVAAALLDVNAIAPPAPLLPALFPVNVLFEIVTLFLKRCIAPPLELVIFPSKLELSIVKLPESCWIAPPPYCQPGFATVAVLLLNVEFIMFKVPELFFIAPPFPLLLALLIIASLRFSDVFAWISKRE